MCIDQDEACEPVRASVSRTEKEEGSPKIYKSKTLVEQATRVSNHGMGSQGGWGSMQACVRCLGTVARFCLRSGANPSQKAEKVCK